MHRQSQIVGFGPSSQKIEDKADDASQKIWLRHNVQHCTLCMDRLELVHRRVTAGWRLKVPSHRKWIDVDELCGW